METVTDFIFLGSKITGDCDCSQEIKRHLLLGTKALTKLDSLLKSRDISLPKKVHIVSNSDDFPVVMYRCQNWTIKKAEHWRIDAVVLEKTLESPLDRKEIKATNPKGNQLWIFTGRTDAELKLQQFGQLMQRADSLEKTLMLGNTEGTGSGRQRKRRMSYITDSTDVNLSKLQ